MYKKISFWRAYENADRTEGRGPMRPLKYSFISKEEALAFVGSQYYADTYGVQGTPGDQYSISEEHITIYNSAAEALESTKDDIRKNALKKLTTAEKLALGIKDEDPFKKDKLDEPTINDGYYSANWIGYMVVVDIGDRHIRLSTVNGIRGNTPVTAEYDCGTWSVYERNGNIVSLA